jgi:TPR repeat protein
VVTVNAMGLKLRIHDGTIMVANEWGLKAIIYDGNSNSRSIPVEKLRDLLDAIKTDHPQWDGFSQTLADIFKAGLIDPKVKYARFYSSREPFLVISYTWRSTSLRRLANICDGTDPAGCDFFGKPLHLGKTTWIDVLFTPQFGLDPTAENSKRIVEITAERYGSAKEHLVDLAENFLTRAWCLAELAVTCSNPSIRIIVVGDWAATEAWMAGAVGDSYSFHACMEAKQPGDVALVQKFAEDRFGSAAAFDAAVRGQVLLKLRAGAHYRDAINRFYGLNGFTKDQAAGRVLFERAAALGHADAIYYVGMCYGWGLGGLKKNQAARIRYYRRAADGGSAIAQGRLALLYLHGSPAIAQGRLALFNLRRSRAGGLPRDAAAAARLGSLAADQGDNFALCQLGRLLEEGEDGVERDAGRAVECYRLCVVRSHPSSKEHKESLEGLQRLGAKRLSDVGEVRLEAVRLSRLDAARRGGTPAQLVALAIAGGPEWDRLAAKIAHAAVLDEADEDWCSIAEAKVMQGRVYAARKFWEMHFLGFLLFSAFMHVVRRRRRARLGRL